MSRTPPPGDEEGPPLGWQSPTADILWDRDSDTFELPRSRARRITPSVRQSSTDAELVLDPKRELARLGAAADRDDLERPYPPGAPAAPIAFSELSAWLGGLYCLTEPLIRSLATRDRSIRNPLRQYNRARRLPRGARRDLEDHLDVVREEAAPADGVRDRVVSLTFIARLAAMPP